PFTIIHSSSCSFFLLLCYVTSILPVISLKSVPSTEFYSLSLLDALPIFPPVSLVAKLKFRNASARETEVSRAWPPRASRLRRREDRKSTRLNSSHVKISYAVFCLKKKNIKLHYTMSFPFSHYLYNTASST